MATTTVRLDPDEEHTLDTLAEIHGGRSNALRVGLRLLAEESRRHASLEELLNDWEADSGPVSEEDVAAMSDRYGLDP